MPSALSDRPDVGQLEQFVGRALAERGDEIAFVVLFGSMARGTWSRGSDYDVLVGLSHADGLRLIDRIGELDRLVSGNIQVFPYAEPEWRRMVDEFHPLLLEALEHGVVLVDRGAFAELKARFAGWRRAGVVTPLPNGWRIAPEAGERRL